MNRILAVSVLTSILILGTIGLSENVFADDFIISDSTSCVNAGGIWNGVDTCTITNFELQEDEILAPLNGVTLVLINTINNGEIDVQSGNIILEGITEGEGSYFVDLPGVLTINNGELILEGDLIIGDNGGGKIVNTVTGLLIVTDAGAVTIEVGVFDNFGIVNVEGGTVDIFAAHPLVNPTPDPGIFNNYGFINIDLFESQFRTEGGLDGAANGLLYNDGSIIDITTETGELFGEFLNEGTIQEDCNSVISVPISGNPTIDVCANNDSDNDGFNSVASGGTDCDDFDDTVFPGATEIIGDGIDQDCDDSDLTATGAIENTVSDIDELVNVGDLNNGNGNALASKLDNAITQIDKGNTNTGINKLNSFINQVNAFVNSGKLSSQQGQDLIDAAQTIIDSL